MHTICPIDQYLWEQFQADAGAFLPEVIPTEENWQVGSS